MNNNLEAIINGVCPNLENVDRNMFLTGFSFLDKDGFEKEELSEDLDERALLGFMVSKKRYRHSLSVAALCRKIALIHGLDGRKAYIAGMLHDCGKRKVDGMLRPLIEEYMPEYLDFPEWAYHQFAGAFLAKETFKIEDEDILEAIRFHATGKKESGTYAKLVYACDKIDPLRGYDSKYMIDAMEKDIDEGFAFVLQENKDYLSKNGYKVDNPLTRECFIYYKIK